MAVGGSDGTNNQSEVNPLIADFLNEEKSADQTQDQVIKRVREILKLDLNQQRLESLEFMYFFDTLDFASIKSELTSLQLSTIQNLKLKITSSLSIDEFESFKNPFDPTALSEKVAATLTSIVQWMKESIQNDLLMKFTSSEFVLSDKVEIQIDYKFNEVINLIVTQLRSVEAHMQYNLQKEWDAFEIQMSEVFESFSHFLEEIPALLQLYHQTPESFITVLRLLMTQYSKNTEQIEAKVSRVLTCIIQFWKKQGDDSFKQVLAYLLDALKNGEKPKNEIDFITFLISKVLSHLYHKKEVNHISQFLQFLVPRNIPNSVTNTNSANFLRHYFQTALANLPNYGHISYILRNEIEQLDDAELSALVFNIDHLLGSHESEYLDFDFAAQFLLNDLIPVSIENYQFYSGFFDIIFGFLKQDTARDRATFHRQLNDFIDKSITTGLSDGKADVYLFSKILNAFYSNKEEAFPIKFLVQGTDGQVSESLAFTIAKNERLDKVLTDIIEHKLQRKLPIELGMNHVLASYSYNELMSTDFTLGEWQTLDSEFSLKLGDETPSIFSVNIRLSEETETEEVVKESSQTPLEVAKEKPVSVKVESSKVHKTKKQPKMSDEEYDSIIGDIGLMFKDD